MEERTGKNNDVMFEILVGTGIWGNHQHKPFIFLYRSLCHVRFHGYAGIETTWLDMVGSCQLYGNYLS